MKNLTLSALALCFSYLLPAQSDWQLFRPNVQYLYDYPDASYVEAPVVGIKAGTEPCTEMYASLRWRGEFECNELAGSLMGYEVCQTETLTQLRTKENEYVTIQQAAPLNVPWIAYTYFTDTVWAKVFLIQEEIFLGLTDSVKSIHFYRKRPDGSPDYVPGDNRPLKISKNYGVISTFWFRDFNSDLQWTEQSINPVTLTGLSEPRVGLQNPELNDIFNLQTGDELHILATGSGEYYTQQEGFLGIAHWRSFLKCTITGVTMPTPSQLRYAYTGQRLGTREIGPPSNSYEVFPIENVTDTLKYDLDELAFLDLQPGAATESPFSFGDFMVVSLQHYGFCDKTGKYLSASVIGGPDCYQPIVDGAPSHTYVEDLAGGYYTNWENPNDTRHVVYFRSDSTECGTPFDFEQITAAQEITAAPRILLGPNPTNGAVTLQLPEGLIADLKLYDTYGRMLLTANQASGTVEWNMAHLPAGTYQASAWQHGRLLWRGTLLKL